MDAAAQVRLLQALEERSFNRAGGGSKIRTDVRVLATTSRDLESLCSAGEFRVDLFHELNGFTINLPPLRKREDDLRHLLAHFLAQFNRRLTDKVKCISSEAALTLQDYHWPGNVREVEALLSRAMLSADHAVLEPGDFPSHIRAAAEESFDEATSNF